MHATLMTLRRTAASDRKPIPGIVLIRALGAIRPGGDAAYSLVAAKAMNDRLRAGESLTFEIPSGAFKLVAPALREHFEVSQDDDGTPADDVWVEHGLGQIERFLSAVAAEEDELSD